MKIKQILIISFACLVSALLAVGLHKAFTKNNTNQTIIQQEGQGFETVSYTKDQKNEKAGFDFTLAAQKGLPSVVHIQSTIKEESASNGQQMPRSFLDDFFGIPYEQGPREGIGFGSGVIISPDGYIITNNHVIEHATEIKVTFYDNNIVDAELIGTDPTTDIALLKVKKNDLSYLKFANSDQIEVGQWVAAIGNPAVGTNAFTLKSTVTAGIVSATGRRIGINQETYAIESFIQTDAVINKGNSGGALVNVNGDLVGINTAISTPTGVYAGYGFAVPSNLVKKVITDLKEYGSVQRAVLGVRFTDIESATSGGASLDTKEKEGLYISSVSPGGSADKAGIKAGDVFIEVDGNDVTDEHNSHLQEIIGRKRPGDEIKVVYKRNGKEYTSRIKLLSTEAIAKNYQAIRNVTNFDDLGIEVEELSNDEKKQLDLSSGLRVSSADPRGILYRNSYGDIQPGFIITKINNKPVNTVNDMKRALKANNQGIMSIEGVNENNPSDSYMYQFRYLR